MFRPVSAAFAILLAASTLAQELPLTGVSYVAAPSWQRSPQMASDGTNYLVAWRDGRGWNNYDPIFAARVSADGRLLDEPTAISVPDAHDETPSSSTSAPPAVVWTGRVYLVAWADIELRAMQIVRIDRDGRVLDARPRRIAGIDFLSWGAGASTGDGALIVSSASGAPNPDSVYATTFDADGEIVQERIAFSHGLSDLPPSIAANGDGFLAAWLRWTGTFHRLVVAGVSRAGVIGPERTVGVARAMPVIASNGGDFLVVYTDRNQFLVTERFDANGNTIASTTLPEMIPDLFLSAAMAPYGSDYLLAYTAADGTLHTLLLDRNGRPLGTRAVNQRGRSEGPIALASNGTSTAAAWPQSGASLEYDIYARVLDVQSGETLLSRAALTQTHLRVAPSANGYLGAFLGWPDRTGLRVARVTSNGARLDGEGILIDDDVTEAASVAFDGRNNVVLWKHRHAPCEVRINRVAPNGALLDGREGRVLTTACWGAGVGSNGLETLFVWSSTEPDSTPVILAKRMKQDGTLDDATIRIPSRGHPSGQFAIAWTRGTWLVVWQESIPDTSWWQMTLYQRNILAARISEAGTVLDGVPIVIAESPYQEDTPAVAANGSDFLVAWHHLLADRASISARHVGVDGIAGNVIHIADTRRDDYNVSLSILASGANYLVAWSDRGDVFHTLAGSGTRVPLAASGDPEREITLLPSASGFAAFYERVASESLYGSVPRAFFRFVNSARKARAVR